MGALEDLQDEAARAVGAPLPLQGMGVYSSRGITADVVSVIEPTLLLIAQGAKRAVVADRVLDVVAGHYLVVTVDLPMSSRVVSASSGHPYLAVGLPLRMDLLSELAADDPANHPVAGEPVPPAAMVSTATPELLDAVRRILAVRARPREAAALLPGMERELYWRLLDGDSGAALRTRLHRIRDMREMAAALAWIRDHLYERLRFDELADIARMSPATFRRRFTAVTSTTPLGYQKLLRLHEARRRLQEGGIGVSGAAAATGFAHRSQFTREYRRMFGRSPADERRGIDASPEGSGS